MIGLVRVKTIGGALALCKTEARDSIRSSSKLHCEESSGEITKITHQEGRTEKESIAGERRVAQNSRYTNKLLKTLTSETDEVRKFIKNIIVANFTMNILVYSQALLVYNKNIYLNSISH